MFLVSTEWWTATMTDLFTNKTGVKTTFTTGKLKFITILLQPWYFIFLSFQFCKQYLVCGHSCGSSVWMAQELYRECQQQEVREMTCWSGSWITLCRWIPDLKSGWEYRPLVRTMDHLDSNSWHSDDGSLRIEYLRGRESILNCGGHSDI